MTSLPGDPPHWQHCHHISSSVWPGLSTLGDSPMVSLSFLSTLGNIGTLGKFVFPHLCKFITFVIFRLMVKFHFCQVHCPISFVISHPLANLPFLYLFCKFVIFVTFIFSANMPSSGYRFIIQSIMAF